MSSHQDQSPGKRRRRQEPSMEVELVFVDADNAQTRLQRAMKIILQAACRVKEEQARQETIDGEQE